MGLSVSVDRLRARMRRRSGRSHERGFPSSTPPGYPAFRFPQGYGLRQPSCAAVPIERERIDGTRQTVAHAPLGGGKREGPRREAGPFLRATASYFWRAAYGWIVTVAICEVIASPLPVTPIAMT